MLYICCCKCMVNCCKLLGKLGIVHSYKVLSNHTWYMAKVLSKYLMVIFGLVCLLEKFEKSIVA